MRSGVARAVISPGSRSTPLAFAFARHPGIEAVPVLDERSAGFFALGMAKQDMRPVALLCTSGTAGANYLPAVIEAHESGVPLDRHHGRPAPRDARLRLGPDDRPAAGSTAPSSAFTTSSPSRRRARRYFATCARLCAHAVERALAPLAGPVHLNAPFRDPLAPTDDGGATGEFAAGIGLGGLLLQRRAAGTGGARLRDPGHPPLGPRAHRRRPRSPTRTGPVIRRRWARSRGGSAGPSSRTASRPRATMPRPFRTW